MTNSLWRQSGRACRAFMMNTGSLLAYGVVLFAMLCLPFLLPEVRLAAGQDAPPTGLQRRECPKAFLSDKATCSKGGCTRARGIFAGRFSGQFKTLTSPNKQASACCLSCAEDPDCSFWTWTNRTGARPRTTCLLYTSPFLCDTPVRNWIPWEGAISGGDCSASGTDDPHFVGAEGTRFDFSGTPGGNFCLIADKRLHINMQLSGYYDSREFPIPFAEGAMKLPGSIVEDDHKNEEVGEDNDDHEESDGGVSIDDNNDDLSDNLNGIESRTRSWGTRRTRGSVLNEYDDSANVVDEKAGSGSRSSRSSSGRTRRRRRERKAVIRTWIRALGVRFDAHSIVMQARSDGNPARLDGYMEKIMVDGQDVKLQPGESMSFADGLIEISHKPVTHFDGFEQDNFDLKIADMLYLKMRLRAAGRQWQTAKDAESHINIDVRYLRHTPRVHGVLGQTYRPLRKTEKTGWLQEGKEGEPEKQHEQEEEGRRRSYKMIIGYQGKAQVEGANGDGFLDGEMEDYRTTGILATDCKFAVFQGPEGTLSLS